MASFVVTALHLNLRSAPDPKKRNVIAVLPQGTRVERVDKDAASGWVLVDAELANGIRRGYVNPAFLGKSSTVFPKAKAKKGKLPIADLGSRPSEKRTAHGTRAYSIGETGKPGKPSSHASGKAAGLVRLIDWLDVGNPSHLRWKGGGAKTFCNVYVYDVCDAAGCYIPRVWWTATSIGHLNAGQAVEAKYGSTVMEMRANYIFNWLVEFGEAFGWKRLFETDALQSEVNAGRVGIICAQKTNMESPGHIQIVAPEHGPHAAKRNAAGKVVQPLQSNAGASNFNYGFLGPTWWQAKSFRQAGFWTNDAG